MHPSEVFASGDREVMKQEQESKLRDMEEALTPIFQGQERCCNKLWCLMFSGIGLSAP